MWQLLTETEAQAKQFLSGAFLPEDPGNPEVFELQEYSMQAIFNMITSCTRIFAPNHCYPSQENAHRITCR
jgi:hypothetical protein